MGAWGDGHVGRKGIWVLAGTTTSSDMSVSVCGVTDDRKEDAQCIEHLGSKAVTQYQARRID